MNNLKIALFSAVIAICVTACNDNSDSPAINPSVEGDPSALDLVGTSEQGATLSADEFKALFGELSSTNARTSCNLGSDVGCDEVSAPIEFFITNCTDFIQQIPIGTINTTIHYRSLIYYVDSDSDINLDQYEDEMQDLVTDVTGGTAIAVVGDVIYKTCNDRTNNSAVIKFTVYKLA